MAKGALKVPEAELEHLRKCLASLEFYCKTHLKIVPKDDPLKALEFKRAQRIVHEKLAQQKRDKGYIRAIILKARQEGISTYVAGRFFREVNLISNRKAFILSHDMDSAETLFKMYWRFYENLDDGIKPEKVANNRGRYLELVNGSILTVATAGNEDAGTSHTIHRLHASEMAKWPNAEDVWTAVEETVPPPPASAEIIIESTAKGVGNLFHSMWEMAVSGDSEFVPIFLPWWIHEEYAIPLSDEQRKEILATQDPYERKCLDEGFLYDEAWAGDGEVYKLTAEQIAWRRFKIRSKRGNERAFRQENPATPEEAFLSTGDCFFDTDALDLMEPLTSSPLIRGHFVELASKAEVHVQESDRGWLRIWEQPKKDTIYAIGADTAYGAQERIGLSEEEDEQRSRTDYSCAWVMDVVARKIVACLHGKIAAEAFAKQLNWLSYHYGERQAAYGSRYVHPAFLAVERNHESGITVIKKLQTEHRHPNLYYSKLIAVRAQGQATTVCGWHTTKNNRGPMLDELAEAVAAHRFEEMEGKQIYVPDKACLREMRTFILHHDGKDKVTKAAAADGAHDDRVMSLAITLQASQNAHRYVPSQPEEPKTYSGPTGLFDYNGEEDGYDTESSDNWPFNA